VNARRSSSPFANRIVIGALTVLVLIIAVFLAYNANSGLPFVPTYNINTELPDASGLLVGDGVLIGGTRVGYVSAVNATKLANGRAIAVLQLKLNRSVQPLPADSTDLVRPVSPLGLKYLEITRGHSRQTLSPGATIPLSHSSLPVEIGDVFSMFNAPTRRASQIDFNEFGDGLAARGPDLNNALSQAQSLVDNLLPATTNLMDPRTRWAALFPSLEQAAHEVFGVSGQEAQLFAGLDETFTPLSQATPALRASIAGGPPALRTAAHQLPAQAQFVDDTAELFHRFRPAFASLGQASTQLAPAEAAGIPALDRAPALNGRLVATLQAIQRLADDPRTLPGLAQLTETAQLIEPTVAYIEPAQTTCNYLALFFRNLENALSESDQVGTVLRVLAITLPQLANSEAGPSSAPANGPPASAIPGLSPLQLSLVDDSFLHANPYPHTAAPGQPKACAAGNEQYIPGRKVIGNPPLLQKTTQATRRVLP
jgi:virulence factor Mce-like protein